MNKIALKEGNYIAFDVETTGLDTQKDEIIQIGIVQFDHNFEIKKKFSSLVKPQKRTPKELVQYLTQIKPQDLHQAPPFDHIKEHILEFFEPAPTLIWHNIGFDIQMLKKYIPDLPVKNSIDTFPLVKNIFHFLPSYSLEVIWILLDFDQQAHDALSDSLVSLKVFQYFLKHLNRLIQKYPFLIPILYKTKAPWQEVLILPPLPSYKNLSLPHLKKTIKSSKRLIWKNFFNTHSQVKAFNISKANINYLLPELIKWEDKIVLAFATHSKQKVAQTVLSHQWLPFKILGYENITFNNEKIKKLLNQKELKDFETLFIIKYMSQYLQQQWMIDINSSNDFKILQFLKNENSSSKNMQKWIYLTTHTRLFEYISELTEQDFKILIFDEDLLFGNFLRSKKQTLDLYKILQKLETLEYIADKNEDKKLLKLINDINKKLTIFMGVFFSEASQLFSQYKTTSLEMNFLSGDVNFYKTSKALENLQDLLQENLQIKILKEIYETLKDFFESPVIIYQKTFGKEFYYTLEKANQFVDYQSFKQLISSPNIFLFWYNDKSKEIITPKPKITIKPLKENIIKDLKKLETHGLIYIISPKKEISQKLFESFFEQWIEKIIVENITGGRGKNLILIKENKTESQIVIWGFEFLFNLFGEKIIPQNIYHIWASGPNFDSLIKDIYFYYPKDEKSTSNTNEN